MLLLLLLRVLHQLVLLLHRLPVRGLRDELRLSLLTFEIIHALISGGELSAEVTLAHRSRL